MEHPPDAPVVLVVEDEPLIQILVEEALSDGGFKSETVGSGEEAIALLEGDSARYRALLTDINVQGELTGWDVARRARELQSEIPVVYMTGAAAEQWNSQGVPNTQLLNRTPLE